MTRSLWIIAVLMTLASCVAFAQVDARTENRTRPVPPGQNAPTQQVPAGKTEVSGQGSATEKNANDPTAVRLRIQQAFQQDPGLANRNLGAYVSTDTVSLAGTVASKADRDRAESIAQSMAAGRAVVNDIRVNSSPNYIGRSDPSASSGTFVSPPGTFTSPSGTGTSNSGSSGTAHKTPPRR